MTEINWDWVATQLRETDTAPVPYAAIKLLMQTLEDLELDETQLREVLMKFHELGLGHSIIPSKPRERWAPIYPGTYSVGDTVRVKPDAYSGKRAVHNGQRGRVVVAHGDQILVVYSDAPELNGRYYHLLPSLERLL